jgi:4-amino-4-deoxy-L-arabinose transferase-like glycosyltransferase
MKTALPALTRTASPERGNQAQAGTPRARVTLLIVWAVLVLAPLPVRELMPPDEPRFALVAREMSEGVRSGHDADEPLVTGPGWGDWIVPKLCGAVYADKPPLLFWLINLSSLPAGSVRAMTARIPSALATLLVLFLTARLGARLFGSTRIGYGGAAILLTGSEFYQKTQWASTDMLLVAFTLLGITCWREGLFDSRFNSEGSSRPGYPSGPESFSPGWKLVAGWIAAAAATLTKGGVGLIWPLAWVLAEAAARRQGRRLSALLRPAGPLLFLGIVGGWLLSAEILSGGGFIREAILRQTFERYVSAWNNQEPWYFYLYQMPLDLAPWSFFLPATVFLLIRARPGRGGPAGEAGEGSRGADPAVEASLHSGEIASRNSCALFILAGLLFFSISTGKRGVYLLPAFPAASLLICHAYLGLPEAGRGSKGSGGSPWRDIPLRVITLLGLGSVIALPLLAGIATPSIGPVQLGAGALAGLVAGALALTIGAGTALALSRRNRPEASMAALVAGLLVLCLTAGTLAAHVASGHQNAGAFGREIAARVPHGQAIAVERGKFEVILFYSERAGFPFEGDKQLLSALDAGRARYVVLERRTFDRLAGGGLLDTVSLLHEGKISTTEYLLLGPPG